MADDNKPMQYLRYAIGEIVLVVIGILIALQINNWNEEQKTKAKTQTAFKEILKDLDKDILRSNEIIDYLENKDSLLGRVLSKEVTTEDYLATPDYGILVTSFEPITISSKGYEKLMELSSNLPDDSYIDQMEQIKSLYGSLVKDLDFISLSVANYSKKIIEKYADSYAWFSTSNKSAEEEQIAFYLNNPIYLNEAYLCRIYSTGNYLRELYRFKYDAILCYQAIHKTLDLKEPLPEYIGYILQPQPEMLKKFVGHYKIESSKEKEIMEIEQKGNNLFTGTGVGFLMLSENILISYGGRRHSLVFELDEKHTVKGFNVLKNNVIIQRWKKQEKVK